MPSVVPSPELDLLVIEDDDDHATLLQRALRRSRIPARLRRVRDIAEAKEALDERVPQLVLLDLQLGHEDGCTLLETWRRERSTRRLPVLVLTTSDNHRDRDRAAEHHPNAYLIKPTDPSAWSEMMHDITSFWRWHIGLEP